MSEQETMGPDATTRMFSINGVAFAMKLVERGTFLMGETDDQEKTRHSEALPVHEVTIAYDFYMGEMPVTKALWNAVMTPKKASTKMGNMPAVGISWEECQAFVSKLNQEIATDGCFSLPTEAEWEYAARGGNKTCHYCYAGSDNPDEVGWYDDISGSKTKEVGLKAPNELGIYDMSGNVAEWCLDIFKPDYKPDSLALGECYVLRGGTCWPQDMRVSSRSVAHYEQKGKQIGMRLAYRPKEVNVGLSTSVVKDKIRTFDDMLKDFLSGNANITVVGSKPDGAVDVKIYSVKKTSKNV